MSDLSTTSTLASDSRKLVSSLKRIFTGREWSASWFGTAPSGCVYGAYQGFIGFGLGTSTYAGSDSAIRGGFAGLIIAGFVGALVFLTVATLLWAFCLLDRNKIADKALAGGLPGLICAGFGWPECIRTATLGAIGSCVPVLIRRQRESTSDSNVPVQLSIRTLLLRMFVAAVLLVVWKYLLYLLNNPQDW
ncbi:MAG: hypothetical protein KDB27_09145 [Planctomycetales bacterium]|nr:hypothetical protein [Planctomycetales bacterium]